MSLSAAKGFLAATGLHATSNDSVPPPGTNPRKGAYPLSGRGFVGPGFDMLCLIVLLVFLFSRRYYGWGWRGYPYGYGYGYGYGYPYGSYTPYNPYWRTYYSGYGCPRCGFY